MKPPSYSKAWTLYPYETPLKEAICQFKYKGRTSLARPLGDLMVRSFNPLVPIDSLIPVPLHPHRLREREFNQSLLLADQLSYHMKLPVLCNTLIRVRPSVPQATLKRKERLKNLRRTFTVLHPSRIQGKSILLVDDVFTTGTTVNECAKTLRKSGSGPVYVITLARMS